MKVIGAGFGRTGTLSVKAALETLGFGPCYHMVTAFERPDHLRAWRAAHEGRAVDWEALFTGFGSTMDWPACTFWEQLLDACPQAKVVLTVRDPERWYESFRETLVPLWGTDAAAHDRPSPEFREYLALVRRIGTDTFGGRLDDREHVVAAYAAHNRRVREKAPADRLLVYEVGQGWQPLCAFLGVDVPDGVAFPRLNDRDSFQEMVRRRLSM
ncbi:sulfotransferase family protein [Streptomyces shenzhenensis]|uniref:sulfotransferase family protein n=1 Tax=Streptomyces shenzhenensis TaxID=943815 RepID=UPI0015F08818|nr:sulfotransferase [Streptomyces shenzhenensis]